jgi:hypothetical protein
MNGTSGGAGESTAPILPPIAAAGSPAVLAARIEVLRREQAQLLLTGGATPAAVRTRVSRTNAINAEAAAIVRELRVAGHHEAADEARHGWAVVIAWNGRRSE